MESADAESVTRTSLNGHGVFAIIVFAVVALICIQPIHIPLPFVVSAWADRARIKLFGPLHEESREPNGEDRTDANSSGRQTPVPPPATAGGVVEEATSEEQPHNHVQPSTQSSQNIATPRQRKYLVLNHVWTPAIGILFLLATTTIDGEQIRLGIVGEEGIEPYDVLALFLGLAYIAISLDATGFLRYLAFQVCLKAGTNGRGLYLVLYGFFWTLGVLVGNDPVILSGTAFLVYLTRVAGISPPSAWIWAQFVAANISSAVLVSSNPTNLVIASGFRISFPVYTAYMILPAFVSALVTLGVLLLFFRNRDAPKRHGKIRSSVSRVIRPVAERTDSSLRARSRQGGRVGEGIQLTSVVSTSKDAKALQENGEATHEGLASNGSASIDDENEEDAHHTSPIIFIPRTIVRPDVNARAALVDPYGAVFASIVMAGTLVTLIATSVTGGVKVYMIAAPGAGVCLLRDIAYDLYNWRKVRKDRARIAKVDAETSSRGNTRSAREGGQKSAADAGNTEAAPRQDGNGTDREGQRGAALSPSLPLLGRLAARLASLTEVFPTVTYVAVRLPLPLLPFAFGMFILVQSLAHVGFVNILAGGLGNVCMHGYVGCSFFLSTLGVILCNLGGTNIGATILLTKALQTTFFRDRLPQEDSALIIKAASYSVAFGSNVGALGGTFAASLAGLLWRDGLHQRGVLVTKLQFAQWCAVVIIPALTSGVAILLPQVRYFSV